MSDFIVLYNPKSGAGTANPEEALKKLFPDDALTLRDITSITDYRSFFEGCAADAKILLCGGDGTLSRFINDSFNLTGDREIYYFATGTGNDFLRDIGKEPGSSPICINEYMKDLPIVEVKDKTCRFINNVGFGIDGYCTETGDKMKAEGKTDINYAGIAIKGMLGKFHPVNAKITVDGNTKEYKKVWLAPTMKGRFYGGGMMAAPNQDRNDPEHSVSVMLMYGKGKLKTLMVFPSIFKGEHVKHKELCEVITGHDITVEFDRPCALQIDGETVPNVTSYHVKA